METIFDFTVRKHKDYSEVTTHSRDKLKIARQIAKKKGVVLPKRMYAVIDPIHTPGCYKPCTVVGSGGFICKVFAADRYDARANAILSLIKEQSNKPGD